MGAPSSEQEARQIAAEIAARPNLAAVTGRMLEVIETLAPGRRRTQLETMVGVLDMDLRPDEDICEAELKQWMEVLAS